LSLVTDPLARLVSLEGVASAYAAARDGIDDLQRDSGLRKTTPEQTGESLLRGAHATAMLSGSTATLAEVRAGEGDELAIDAVRLSTELLSLVPVIATAPLQALARLHALAATGRVDDDALGRPVSAEAAVRLRGLADLLSSPTTAPALVVATIVHADLVTSAPFASHNGMVARAAERLVLVTRGVDPKSLTVPEAGHLALREEFESNLRGYASSTQAGVHAWLLYGAEAFTAGAEASPLRRDAQ
jgi:hypothetical protein